MSSEIVGKLKKHAEDDGVGYFASIAILEAASHIEALEASVERLLTHWDERVGVEKRGSFEGVEYWSPAGRMVDTDFIADLRKTLSQAKE